MRKQNYSKKVVWVERRFTIALCKKTQKKKKKNLEILFIDFQFDLIWYIIAVPVFNFPMFCLMNYVKLEIIYSRSCTGHNRG